MTMRRNHALLLAFVLLLCLTLTFVACKGKNNGKKPVGTTAATTVTTSPVEDPTDEPKPGKKGCGSAIGLSVLLIMGGAAPVIRKKKED